MKPTITQEKLAEVLHYNPETGEFHWLQPTSARVKVGAIAGCRNKDGYHQIVINWTAYPAHRLVWLYVYGRWPAELLDHVNGCRTDNRLCNLRECTHAENMQNRKMHRDNTSGFSGVTYHFASSRWQAHIRVKGKQTYLGSFVTPEAAYLSYLKAKGEWHTFCPTPRQPC